MTPTFTEMLSKWMQPELTFILILSKRHHWANLFMETSAFFSMITKMVDNWEHFFYSIRNFRISLQRWQKVRFVSACTRELHNRLANGVLADNGEEQGH